jgi:hypothetical protein
MTPAIAAEPRSERTFDPTSRGEGEKVMDSKSEPVPIIVSTFVGESGAGQLAGLAGIGIFFLSAAVIPLYFFPFDEPPPRWNVLTRVLVDMFVPVGFVVFVSGLRHTIVSERPALEWLGTLCLALGLALVVLTFVAHSIQAGSFLAAQERRVDPTRIGSGAEGALLIYGPRARLLTATFLASVGSAIILTGALPGWTGWLAYAVGAFHLALVPTIFYKTDPAFFYSVNGWGIPVAGGLLLGWVLMVGVLLVLRN